MLEITLGSKTFTFEKFTLKDMADIEETLGMPLIKHILELPNSNTPSKHRALEILAFLKTKDPTITLDYVMENIEWKPLLEVLEKLINFITPTSPQVKENT